MVLMLFHKDLLLMKILGVNDLVEKKKRNYLLMQLMQTENHQKLQNLLTPH